jgi:hypothetical protein
MSRSGERDHSVPLGSRQLLPEDQHIMTRSAARRANAVQVEKSLPPASDETDDALAAPPSASAVSWYWRLALFLWGTSYVFLSLYEWLAGLIKLIEAWWGTAT